MKNPGNNPTNPTANKPTTPTPLSAASTTSGTTAPKPATPNTPLHSATNAPKPATSSSSSAIRKPAPAAKSSSSLKPSAQAKPKTKTAAAHTTSKSTSTSTSQAKKPATSHSTHSTHSAHNSHSTASHATAGHNPFAQGIQQLATHTQSQAKEATATIQKISEIFTNLILGQVQNNTQTLLKLAECRNPSAITGIQQQWFQTCMQNATNAASTLTQITTQSATAHLEQAKNAVTAATRRPTK